MHPARHFGGLSVDSEKAGGLLNRLRIAPACALILGEVVLVGALHSVSLVMAQGGWEAVGPEGGFAWDLAISPSYASDATVFAGVTGGVLRSLDGGDTWHRADRGLDDEFVPAIALSPGFEADGTLFAGTSGGGVYVSTDRADS